MSALSDKIAYLRGLAAGMKISEETDEGRLLKQIIDVLGRSEEHTSDSSHRCTSRMPSSA